MTSTPDARFNIDLTAHHAPVDFRDRLALRIVKFMRIFADEFFAKRYSHWAAVLESVAAVPGMVGGLLQHFKLFRHNRDEQGWIKALLEDADNERLHLMTFIEIAQPMRVERWIIMPGHAVFITPISGRICSFHRWRTGFSDISKKKAWRAIHSFLKKSMPAR